LCVMPLDDRAKLLRANPAAEALLREGDGLAVMGGRVVAPDRRAASRFRNLLARHGGGRFGAGPR
jgi:hypothetical protein